MCRTDRWCSFQETINVYQVACIASSLCDHFENFFSLIFLKIFNLLYFIWEVFCLNLIRNYFPFYMFPWRSISVYSRKNCTFKTRHLFIDILPTIIYFIKTISNGANHLLLNIAVTLQIILQHCNIAFVERNFSHIFVENEIFATKKNFWLILTRFIIR